MVFETAPLPLPLPLNELGVAPLPDDVPEEEEEPELEPEFEDDAPVGADWVIPKGVVDDEVGRPGVEDLE